MKSLILFGNGGHCKSCIEVIENTGSHIIKGIIVHPNDSSKNFMNYKIIGNDKNLDKAFSEDDMGLICVGQIKSAEKRIRLFNMLKENKIPIATVKSKFSIISKHSIIKKGTIIMHNSIINPGSIIGMNCILNTNSLIEHDAKVGNHCHISTGVILNGGAEIGNECFIGSGAIIREGVKIGDRSIISSGKIVMNDLPPETILK